MNAAREKDCLFCKIIRRELPAIVVHEDPHVIALMDAYPATPGHMLVLPKEHIEDIFGMPAELGARVMATAIFLATAVKRRLSPAGLNLVQANAAAAGQTIPHFHLHLVPRYVGDGVALQFGHDTTPADAAELERLASLIRSALTREG